MQVPVLLTILALLVIVFPSTLIDFLLLKVEVPIPYHDEVSHLSQFRKFCLQSYDSWHSTLFNPPGAAIPAALTAHAFSTTFNTITQAIGIHEEADKWAKERFDAYFSEPIYFCDINYLRAVNSVLSIVLFIVITLLVRDLTYNPLYPTLKSIVWVQKIKNTTTPYFFTECLVILQSLIIWALPFSLFFYNMAYAETASTLTLVLLFLLSRRLVPFYSCYHRTMTRGYDLRRYFMVFILAIWSISIKQANMLWIAFIIAIVILQSVHHEFYYITTTLSIQYPVPPLPDTNIGISHKYSTNNQNNEGGGSDPSGKPKSKGNNVTQPTTTTNDNDSIPAPYPGTVHPQLRLPSLGQTPVLSFGGSIKGLVKALFSPKIIFNISPLVFAVGGALVVIQNYSLPLLGDQGDPDLILNLPNVPNLTPHWAQIPILLTISAIFLPFFTKLPFISTSTNAERSSSQQVQSKSTMLPPRRSPCAVFWMIFGHIIGIGAIACWLWSVLGHIYPHPTLLLDNRHFTHYIYPVMTGSVQDGIGRMTEFIRSSNQLSHALDSTLGFMNQIITHGSQLTYQWQMPNRIVNLIPQHLQIQIVSIFAQVWTTFYSTISNANVAQITLTPLAIHMFYMTIVTNPLPALLWLLFSTLTVLFTGLIDFRFYIPIVIMSALTIQHREGNVIIRIIHDYLPTRSTSPSRDASDDDFPQNNEPFLSWRAVGWMLLFTTFTMVRFAVLYFFFFHRWLIQNYIEGRLMW